MARARVRKATRVTYTDNGGYGGFGGYFSPKPDCVWKRICSQSPENTEETSVQTIYGFGQIYSQHVLIFWNGIMSKRMKKHRHAKGAASRAKRARQTQARTTQQKIAVALFIDGVLPTPTERDRYLAGYREVILQDQRWFEGNPTRRKRLRPLIPGEFPRDTPGCTHTLVWQLPNKERARMPIEAAKVAAIEKEIEVSP